MYSSRKKEEKEAHLQAQKGASDGGSLLHMHTSMRGTKTRKASQLTCEADRYMTKHQSRMTRIVLMKSLKPMPEQTPDGGMPMIPVTQAHFDITVLLTTKMQHFKVPIFGGNTLLEHRTGHFHSDFPSLYFHSGGEAAQDGSAAHSSERPPSGLPAATLLSTRLTNSVE